MVAPVYYTADMVREVPDDGNRYEVVQRELLVTRAPRPWHQIVLERERVLWSPAGAKARFALDLPESKLP